ncbi:phosphotransferase enzyme family protein [Ophiostoma piceae UAMH 11346]|uniref:Phosphotransferase enzyme family protein n=1 Tax=Ophiostoma piceae (strain UAMH 11346) TaxID=1262450 RepID=S3CED7_OPHP1|nr:phosphotransferase enzyme family protein [Ophiostoma piceae UAMH 11346]
MDIFYMDNTFPPTYEQKVSYQKAFIEAIDPDTVCRLASLHNGGKPCRIFKEKAHGSFNVCFFVEFIDEEPVTDIYHASSADGTPATNAEATAHAEATANPTATLYSKDTESPAEETTATTIAAGATTDATSEITATIDGSSSSTTTAATDGNATPATSDGATETTDIAAADAVTTVPIATAETTPADDAASSKPGDKKDADTTKPTTKWVVRIPTLPTVQEPWEKIRGEVATIRHVEANTKIKVPHVHAFGPAVITNGLEEADKTEDGEVKEETQGQRPEPPVKTNDSNPIGHAYMIIDYIAGDKMDIVGFLKSEQKKRFHFLGQLIDVFAELVCHEFDKGGSLTLDEADEPVLGPMQSMHLDGLQMDLGNKGNTWTPTEGWKKRRRAPKSTMILSAADYALFQYRLIYEAYLQPSTNAVLKNLQFEEMILHDAKGFIFGAINYEQNHGPFVLNHTDLRWSNIIVNDNFDILGIVDWEWSAVIPLQFLVPPFWISGEEAHHVGRDKYWMTLYSLKSILDKRQKDSPSPGHLKLGKAWASLCRQPDSFVVSYLLRHHHEFIAIYKFSVLHEKRKLSPDEFIKHYLGLTSKDSPLEKEAKRKLEYAQKYVQYLHDNGLFVEGENSLDMEKKEDDEEAAAIMSQAATGDRA